MSKIYENKKLMKKIICICVLLAVVAAGAIYIAVTQYMASHVSDELSNEEVTEIILQTIDSLPKKEAVCAGYIADNIAVNVTDVSYGDKRNVIANCEIETIDLYSCVETNLNDYLCSAMVHDKELTKNTGMVANSTAIRQAISGEFLNDLETAEKKSLSVELHIYELNDGNFSLYLSDEMINSFFGGYKEAEALVNSAETLVFGGEEINIKNNTPYRKGVKECFTLNNYDSKEPDTNTPAVKWLNSVKDEFYRNFLEKDNGRPRYMYIVDGLLNTLLVTACSLLIGIVIGFIVAVIRVTNHTTGKLELASGICRLYLAIMRGTPLMIQLLIIYFVVLLPNGVNSITSAIVCFGLNSGAYVSEIVRGGIMSVDKGQTEAGRSIGFTYIQTMYYIVLPQAFKAVLPSLANEFITLLKETSVAFYIGVADLTLGGLKIRSITYSSFMPLIAIALVYLVLVLGLSKCVSILERRLQKGDNR